MSTALAWPAAGSIATTVCIVDLVRRGQHAPGQSAVLETITARAPLVAKTWRWSSTVLVT